MFDQDHLAAIAAAMSVLQQDLSLTPPSPPTNHHELDQQQQALVNHYRTQLQQPQHQQQHNNNHNQQHQQQHQDLHLISSPEKLFDLHRQHQQTNHQHQQQQALVNHYRSQLHRTQHQQPQDHHLISPPPKLYELQRQQQTQQQQALVNQYRTHLQQQQQQQQQDLHLISSPPKLYELQRQLQARQHNQQQQQDHQRNHYDQPAQPQQHHNQPQQTQPRVLINNYVNQQAQQSDFQLTQSPPRLQPQSLQLLANKPSKPVSYSAIVAKSAGLSSNNSEVSTSPAQQLFQHSQILNHHHQHHNQNSDYLNNNQNTNNSNSTTTNISSSTSISSSSNNTSTYNNNNNNSNNVNNIIVNNNIGHSNRVNSAHHMSIITSSPGSATNLLGFMGLYVGNLSPDLTKEQLEKIFSKYGEPVKAHRLIRSPVAFIKYENTESPRAAIDDLYGLLLPELTLNQDQPLKLHFDRNDAQLKANYRPIELPPDADNGECYGWRTTVCRRGKNCPKKHIPINRGIDFQMWMIKSTPTSSAN